MKIISLFFHLPAVVWTTRWTIVKICSVIVRISSELVEISSEPVEISSELVWNSSELVSTILELLIISVFRKRPNRFHTRSFRLAMKLKANPFIFNFIHLFVKSALRTRSREMFSLSKWLKVVRWRTGRSTKSKNYGWHLLVMGITHTMQHRPQFFCPLISYLKSFPTLPNEHSALYLRAFPRIFYSQKNVIGI